MKKIYSKIGILMILIFSFLLSFISTGTQVKALEDKYIQDKLQIDSISFKNKKVEFCVDDNYDLTLATYEFTYYINNVLISELEVDDSLTTDGKGKYTFDIETEHDIEGVKVWKLTYPISDSYNKIKFTEGSNVYGNIDSALKKDWIRIDSKLVSLNSTANSIVDYIKNTLNPITISKNSYGLYFTFDLENDYIADITIEYTTYYRFKPLKQPWLLNFNGDKQTVREEIYNNDKDLIDFSATGILKDFSTVMSPFTDTPFNESIYKLKDSTEFDYLAVINSKLNNYTTLLYSAEAIVDEVAILNIGYYFEGEYFKKEVVNEDTGWTYFVSDQIADKAKDKGKDILKIIAIALVIIVLIYILIKKVLSKVIDSFFTGLWMIIKRLFSLIIKILSLPFKLIGAVFRAILGKIKGKT